jgi:hypothetical protein
MSNIRNGLTSEDMSIDENGMKEFTSYNLHVLLLWALRSSYNKPHM